MKTILASTVLALALAGFGGWVTGALGSSTSDGAPCACCTSCQCAECLCTDACCAVPGGCVCCTDACGCACH